MKDKPISELAAHVGLFVDTCSPGDGVTRYRFFTEDGNSYHSGPSDGIWTALGPKEARAFLAGYRIAKLAALATL